MGLAHLVHARQPGHDPVASNRAARGGGGGTACPLKAFHIVFVTASDPAGVPVSVFGRSLNYQDQGAKADLIYGSGSVLAGIALFDLRQSRSAKNLKISVTCDTDESLALGA